MVDITEEKGYQAITVSDLARRAHVNRATLYRHFDDKDDLFRQGSAALFNGLIEAISDGVASEKDLRTPVVTLTIRQLFQLMERDRRLYRVMLGPGGNPEFARIAQEVIYDFLMDRRIQAMPKRFARDRLRNEILARMITSSLIGLAVWWHTGEPACSAERLAEIYSGLIMEGVTSFT
jgi:AcrR family transcriptional regulator